ncbi:MAG: hypothetical protein ACI9GZ_000557 [Bacteroidia bacterium]|jgi:hypothetical protein
MFDGPDYPKSLDEELFDAWLEKGRMSKLGYSHLLIIWNELELQYLPVYIDNRDSIKEYDTYRSSISQESLVAAYNLYSESRIDLH